jgi:hypothetical protein
MAGAEDDEDPSHGIPLSQLMPASVSREINAFERAASEVTDTVTSNEPPVTNIESIEADPALKSEIYSMIVSNWTCDAIHSYLNRNRGYAPSLSDIRTFAEAIPKDAHIQRPYLHHRFGGQPVVVDPVSEIHRVLALMQERVGAAALIETLDGAPNTNTTRLLESYYGMLKDFAGLNQSLGLLPKTDKAAELPAPSNNQTVQIGQMIVQMAEQNRLAAKGTSPAAKVDSVEAAYRLIAGGDGDA